MGGVLEWSYPPLAFRNKVKLLCIFYNYAFTSLSVPCVDCFVIIIEDNSEKFNQDSFVKKIVMSFGNKGKKVEIA